MVIYEALSKDDPRSRRKGVEFDLEKNASDRMKKRLAANPMTAPIASIQSKNTLSTTSTGVDINDSKMKSRIEYFDKERAQLILESDNIIEEYNKWIEADIEEIIKDSNPDGGIPDQDDLNKVRDEGTTAYFAKVISQIAQMGGSDAEATFGESEPLSMKEIKDYLRGTFYYTSNNPNEIKLLLSLRLKYNQKIVSLMNKMLVINYKILGITDQEMESLSKDLQSDTNKSNQAVKIIKEKIIENRNKFITNNGECIDLSSLGFGKIFMTKGKGKDFTGVNSISNEDNAYNALDTLLQKAMEYNAIVICHGMSATQDEYNALDQDTQGTRNYYKQMKDLAPEAYAGQGIETDDDIDKLPGTTNLSRKGKPIAKDNKMSFRVQRWAMQPIRSDKSQYYTDMNSFVAELIKEGYKSILIGACNPGSHKLDPELMRKARINYSDFSNIIEGGIEYDLGDPLEVGILEGEQELRELSESFGISYDDINDCDYMSLVESKVIDTIKEYAKKVVKFIIGLFKKLWEIFKNAVSAIKKFISKHTGKKLNKPINLKVAVIESAQNKEYNITDEKTLEEAAKDLAILYKKKLKNVNRYKYQQHKS